MKLTKAQLKEADIYLLKEFDTIRCKDARCETMSHAEQLACQDIIEQLSFALNPEGRREEQLYVHLLYLIIEKSIEPHEDSNDQQHGNRAAAYLVCAKYAADKLKIPLVISAWEKLKTSVVELPN